MNIPSIIFILKADQVYIQIFRRFLNFCLSLFKKLKVEEKLLNSTKKEREQYYEQVFINKVILNTDWSNEELNEYMDTKKQRIEQQVENQNF